VKDAKGMTLRMGWERDWPVRSDEFVADLVGGRGGRRRNRRAPVLKKQR
jgi:hypothetical protein